MKSIVKFIFALMFFPVFMFAGNFCLSKADSLFKQERYLEAYTEYAMYLFHFGRDGSEEAFYEALAGKMKCMENEDPVRLIEVDKCIFYSSIYLNPSPNRKKIICDIIKNNPQLNFDKY